MSADGQPSSDPLAVVPVLLRRYSDEAADFLNQGVDRAADLLRHALASAPWLPKPSAPARPPPPPPPLASHWDRVQDWVTRHKVLTAVAVATSATTAFVILRSSRFCRKSRRAKRSRTGARKEVVIISGSPALALTRSLSLDLERRGFIVYVVCTATRDESMVQALSRPDIRPFVMDASDPLSAAASVDRFAAFLQTPQSPDPHIKPTQLVLKSVIVVPNLRYHVSPIATIPPSEFSRLFQVHLLQPIAAMQAFLPLLTSRLTPKKPSSPPKVIVLIPSIITSMSPPFHAPEAIVMSALAAFADVLAAELQPLGVPVTQLRLGVLDLSAWTPSIRAATLSSGNPQEMLLWLSTARQLYGRNFVAQAGSAMATSRVPGTSKGSPLRRLHNVVFDIIDGSITRSSVRVGIGAGIYDFFGRWFPRSVVAWMLGIRRVDSMPAWKPSSTHQALLGQGRDAGDGRDDDSALMAASVHDFTDIHSDRLSHSPEMVEGGDGSLWASSVIEMPSGS